MSAVRLLARDEVHGRRRKHRSAEFVIFPFRSRAAQAELDELMEESHEGRPNLFSLTEICANSPSVAEPLEYPVAGHSVPIFFPEPALCSFRHFLLTIHSTFTPI